MDYIFHWISESFGEQDRQCSLSQQMSNVLFCLLLFVMTLPAFLTDKYLRQVFKTWYSIWSQYLPFWVGAGWRDIVSLVAHAIPWKKVEKLINVVLAFLVVLYKMKWEPRKRKMKARSIWDIHFVATGDWFFIVLICSEELYVLFSKYWTSFHHWYLGIEARVSWFSKACRKWETSG